MHFGAERKCLQIMKILFMGTPDIAAISMKKLISDGFDVVGVVTQPDKPRGRKQILTPPETKTAAIEANIPVFQPEKLKNGELLPILEELSPDLIAVVAYGKMLPDYILDFPKYGCVNMHASLLPRYRGASPIQQAVINGDKITGVTTMKMDSGMDTGDILLSKTIEVGLHETSGELFERIALLGGEVLSETVKNIDSITPLPQDEEKATYAPVLKKEMAEIDWTKSAYAVMKHIFGMNPWPCAYTYYDGGVIKIFTAEESADEPNAEPGEILGFEKQKGLKVKCGTGCVYIGELQAPGSRRMTAEEYLRGHGMEKGTVLGL